MIQLELLYLFPKTSPKINNSNFIELLRDRHWSDLQLLKATWRTVACSGIKSSEKQPVPKCVSCGALNISWCSCTIEILLFSLSSFRDWHRATNLSSASIFIGHSKHSKLRHSNVVVVSGKQLNQSTPPSVISSSFRSSRLNCLQKQTSSIKNFVLERLSMIYHLKQKLLHENQQVTPIYL